MTGPNERDDRPAPLIGPIAPIASPIRLAWRRIDETPGHAYGRIVTIDDATIYEGWEVAASRSTGWAVRFRLVTSRDSIARALEVDADGPLGLHRLSVRRNPRGQWFVDGKRRTDLEACLDIDVAATPLTNTPTIRRLGLAVGERADIDVAWIDVPSLAIAVAEQSYERLEPAAGHVRHRFRAPGLAGSVGSDGLIVSSDPDGVVRDYEAFAKRVFRR